MFVTWVWDIPYRQIF